MPNPKIYQLNISPSKTSLFDRIHKLLKFLIFILFFCLVISFFGKEQFKTVNQPNEETFREPIQEPVSNQEIINFEKAGFTYNITPLYNYDIAGLVVSKFKYDQWFSLSRTDKLFTTDLCIIWGDNVKNKAYQNKTLSVRQDFRFCIFDYTQNPPLFGNQLSNNHIMVNSPEMKKKISAISVGDQVRLKGYLVNVQAKAINQVEGVEESDQMKWSTSITRKDGGAGACEIIYIQDAEILKKGNMFYHYLFNISLLGLILIILWFFGNFIKDIFKP